jgi:hypothetical protein
VNRVARIAVATLVVLLAAVFLARKAGEKGSARPDAPSAGAIRVPPPDSAIAGVVDTQATVGEYTIRVIKDTAQGDRVVDITRTGHRVFAMRANDAHLELVGHDLNNDHVPDVVIQAFSGGMHCCSQAIVLGLGSTVQRLGTIDGADGEIVFDDLDGDGMPDVKVGDFRFAYWRDYAFAETQVPDVILAWREGAYRPACDMMRDDAPSSATLAARARELTRGWTQGDPPAAYWGYAVDLIYGGHPDVAWRWLERSWPAGIGGKDEFLRDLRDKLQGSPCWSPPASGTGTIS